MSQARFFFRIENGKWNTTVFVCDFLSVGIRRPHYFYFLETPKYRKAINFREMKAFM